MKLVGEMALILGFPIVAGGIAWWFNERGADDDLGASFSPFVALAAWAAAQALTLLIAAAAALWHFL